MRDNMLPLINNTLFSNERHYKFQGVVAEKITSCETTRASPFMNKSIGEARKLMRAQKASERSDNKVLAVKTHAAIRDQSSVPQRHSAEPN